LSRAVETRGGDKRPQLSDLRESGAIEQDADMVMFIYRPEYYGILQDEDGNSTQGLGELIVAKHRNGATDNVRVKFENHLAKFGNWDQNAFGISTEADVQVEDDYGRQILKSENWDNVDDSDDEPPF
jgi:replicative DNA helicase